MINGTFLRAARVTAAEVHPDNEAALLALVGPWADANPTDGDDQRMRTQRLPVETDQPLTGVIIPSILPDGSFYREADGRVRENGRDFYVGAVIVKHANCTLDGFATVAEFSAAFPVAV